LNFNMSHKVDYKLQGRHTNELINLYGVSTKLLLTEKISYDETVFGDYQSIKTNKEDTFSLNMMPEVSEEFEDIGMNFSEFGMMNVESCRMFISRKSIEDILGEDIDVVKKLQSNLVILPNNRVMEITMVEHMVPGINNLFTHNDIKNVYKITLKTYDKRLTDNIESINDDSFTEKNTDPDLVGSYKELDEYFDEMMDNSIKQDSEGTEIPNTEKSIITGTPTDKVTHDISKEDSVFGRF